MNLDYLYKLAALESLSFYDQNQELSEIIDKALDYTDHLIRDSKYSLNVGHLKKLRKILLGLYNER